MFVNRGPAFARWCRSAFLRCWSPAWFLCFGAVFGHACGVLPPVPFLGPEPSNPKVAVPPVSYRSVIAPYVSLRPAKPINWQQQNQSVPPQGEAPAHQN
jgi:hypothetical protein